MVARHGISNLYYLLGLALDEAKAREFIGDLLRFVVVAGGVPMRFDMHWPFRGGILKTPCKWRQRFREGPMQSSAATSAIFVVPLRRP